MAVDTDQIKKLLNNINLGTSHAGVGDYVVDSIEASSAATTAAAAVTPIADPSTASAEDVANAVNALITALGTQAQA